MNPSVFRIKLDLHSESPGVTVRISQGDTARRLVCELYEDGRPYTITEECYALFEAVKPGGGTVAGDAVISGGTRIEYGIPSAAVDEMGEVRCCFKVYGAEGMLLTTPAFNIIVTEEVYDTDYPEGTDSFSALDGLISDAIRVVGEASASASDAEASASAAASSALAAENSASAAASSAQSAAQSAAGATEEAQSYANAAAASASSAASKLNSCSAAYEAAKKYAMGQIQSVSGTTPRLFCAEGIRYVCLERVTSLTVYSFADCSIEFITGSSVTVTLPSSCRYATAEPVYKPNSAYVLYFEPFSAAGQMFYKVSCEGLGTVS